MNDKKQEIIIDGDAINEGFEQGMACMTSPVMILLSFIAFIIALLVDQL